MVAFFTAGALIGPSALGWIESPPQVEIMTEGAALILMFTIGLEFSLKELMESRRSLIVLGFGQVVLNLIVFTSLFHIALDFSIEKSIFWSFVVALSSTAVVLKMLSDHRDFESPHGKASFAILLSQDIAVIPMILTIPFLKSSAQFGSSLAESALPILLLAITVLAILYVVNRFVLPLVLFRVAQTKSREVFFFFIIFLVAIFAMGLHSIGLSYSLGAFIAGMLIAGSAYGRQATAEFVPLRNAFLGIFFVTIGMLLDLRFLIENIHTVLLIGAVILSLKALILFAVVWFSGNSGTVARIVALFLFQMGEFSFILADQGLKLNIIDARELQYFYAVAILSLAFTPFVYRLMPLLNNSEGFQKQIPNWIQWPALNLKIKLAKVLQSPIDTTSHNKHEAVDIVIIGFGVAGRSLAKVLRRLSIPYRIIESNGDTVSQFQGREPILFGDASSLEILESAGIMGAKICVMVTSGISTLEPVLRSVRRLRSEIPVIARTNYLLDMARLKDLPLVELVVSEFETTLETIVRVLTKQGIEPSVIDEFSLHLRKELENREILNELKS